MARPERAGHAGQGRRRQTGGYGRGGDDADFAGFILCQPLGALADLAHPVQRMLDLGPQLKGVVGRRDLGSVTLEQLKTEFVLQVADQARDGGLGPIQHLTGARYAADRHDGGEGLKLTIVHTYPRRPAAFKKWRKRQNNLFFEY